MNGFVYLIQLYPQHAPSLYKVGFTKSVGQRIQNHRTLAPHLRLAASWKGSLQDEQRIAAKLKDRGLLIGGEVAYAEEQQLLQIIKEELQ